jgi:hypothetical protein
MKLPSKDWKESVGADEEERHKRYAKMLGLLQKMKSKDYGPGRTLHRKQVLGLEGSLEVLAALPEYAAHGIFASPAAYDCLIRLSNGGLDIKSDSVPDIRGFAIKVQGQSGQGALGTPVTSQDFLLINHEAFSSPNSEGFMNLLGAASQGPLAVLKLFMKEHGFLGALLRMKRLFKFMNKPFSGFATEPFSTVLPIACGPYAVKLRILPASSKINQAARKDLARDMMDRLAEGPLVYEMQLQFYIEEALTPIENAEQLWPETESPFITVAKLTIPQQDFSAAALEKRNEAIELDAFDPWNALEAHRPLGEVMRARKIAYFTSQKGRRPKA